MPLIGSIRPNKREVNRTLLDQWLGVRGVSKLSFSKMVGCDYKTVRYWCWGQVLPDIVYAYLIEKATSGGVPVASWLGSSIGKLLWNQRIQLGRDA